MTELTEDRQMEKQHLENYNSILGSLRSSDANTAVFSDAQHLATTVDSALHDLVSENSELSSIALQLLLSCLVRTSVTSLMTAEQSTDVIKALCSVVHSTKDKVTCNRVFRCIGHQTLNSKSITDELPQILTAIHAGQCMKNFQSTSVEHDALGAIIRLLQQLPNEMAKYAIQWAPLVYPLVLHRNSKVRERAVQAMKVGMPAMMAHQQEVGASLANDLKGMLVKDLEGLLECSLEVHAMWVWSHYVRLLGILLHRGALCNTLLPVVEKCFKNANPAVKMAAFHAWRELIDNFALNPDILSDLKRVKLVMLVFHSNIIHVESVAVEKFRVWWYYVRCLGERAVLLFEQVVVPLLHFAIEGVVSQSSSSSASKRPFKSPSLSAVPGVSPAVGSRTPGGSQAQVFQSVQRLGCQALTMMVLQSLPEYPKYLDQLGFTIDHLRTDLLSRPSTFAKYSSVILAAAKNCFLTVASDVSDDMLEALWRSLLVHVKNLLDTTETVAKSERVDAFTLLLTTFRDIVDAQCISSQLVLVLLSDVVSILPQKVLASSSYLVSDVSDVMQSCPALLLVKILFNHRVLETCSSTEPFSELLDKMMKIVLVNVAGVLGFYQSAVELLCKSVDSIEKPETLGLIWSAIVRPLQEYINKTNEVNQGNNLEHDFSCMYTVLMFPITYMCHDRMPQSVLDVTMKLWDELYQNFARLSAIVDNVEANVSCEQLAGRILKFIDGKEPHAPVRCPQDGSFWLCMSQVLVSLVSHSFDLSGAANKMFIFNPQSPMKVTIRKQKPLGNFHSVVHVESKLLDAIFSSHSSEGVNERLCQCVTSSVRVAAKLFSGKLTTSVLMSMLSVLTNGLAGLFKASSATSRLVPRTLNAELEKLWNDLSTTLQSLYTGSYDSDFLMSLTPLLVAVMSHPRSVIRTNAVKFWNATFGKSSSLIYPASLRPVLAHLKKKTVLLLPSWQSVNVDTLMDTTLGDATQIEPTDGGQLPNVIGIASPKKAVGSFLQRIGEPASSPVKPASPRHGGTTPVKFTHSPFAKPLSGRKVVSALRSLSDMSSQDFVQIVSTKKKTVLTDHQREVLRKKSILPTMYNNLDNSSQASQDVLHLLHADATQTQSELPSQARDELISTVPETADFATPVISPFRFLNDAQREKHESSEVVHTDAEPSKQEMTGNDECTSVLDDSSESQLKDCSVRLVPLPLDLIKKPSHVVSLDNNDNKVVAEAGSVMQKDADSVTPTKRLPRQINSQPTPEPSPRRLSLRSSSFEFLQSLSPCKADVTKDASPQNRTPKKTVTPSKSITNKSSKTTPVKSVTPKRQTNLLDLFSCVPKPVRTPEKSQAETESLAVCYTSQPAAGQANQSAILIDDSELSPDSLVAAETKDLSSSCVLVEDSQMPPSPSSKFSNISNQNVSMSIDETPPLNTQLMEQPAEENMSVSKRLFTADATLENIAMDLGTFPILDDERVSTADVEVANLNAEVAESAQDEESGQMQLESPHPPDLSSSFEPVKTDDSAAVTTNLQSTCADDVVLSNYESVSTKAKDNVAIKSGDASSFDDRLGTARLLDDLEDDSSANMVSEIGTKSTASVRPEGADEDLPLIKILQTETPISSADVVADIITKSTTPVCAEGEDDLPLIEISQKQTPKLLSSDEDETPLSHFVSQPVESLADKQTTVLSSDDAVQKSLSCQHRRRSRGRGRGRFVNSPLRGTADKQTTVLSSGDAVQESLSSQCHRRSRGRGRGRGRLVNSPLHGTANKAIQPVALRSWSSKVNLRSRTARSLASELVVVEVPLQSNETCDGQTKVSVVGKCRRRSGRCQAKLAGSALSDAHMQLIDSEIALKTPEVISHEESATSEPIDVDQSIDDGTENVDEHELVVSEGGTVPDGVERSGVAICRSCEYDSVAVSAKEVLVPDETACDASDKECEMECLTRCTDTDLHKNKQDKPTVPNFEMPEMPTDIFEKPTNVEQSEPAICEKEATAAAQQCEPSLAVLDVKNLTSAKVQSLPVSTLPVSMEVIVPANTESQPDTIPAVLPGNLPADGNHSTGDNTRAAQDVIDLVVCEPELDTSEKDSTSLNIASVNDQKCANGLAEPARPSESPEKPSVNGDETVWKQPFSTARPDGSSVDASPGTPTSATRRRFVTRGTLMLERAKQMHRSSHLVNLSPAPTGNCTEEATPSTAEKPSMLFTRRVYSPSASPSAGILRKRHLAVMENLAESPSPPSKQRRVCFSDQIETRMIPNRHSSSSTELPVNGGKKRSSIGRAGGVNGLGENRDRPVNRQLELSGQQVKSRLKMSGGSRFSALNSASRQRVITVERVKPLPEDSILSTNSAACDVVLSSDEADDEQSSAQTPSHTDSDTSQCPGPLKPLTLHLTPESQLDSTEPIYPDLMDCSASVKVVLSRLTTASWEVALEKHLQSMSILTIGDLASLTEQEVHHLPIAQPKVTNTRRALKRFEEEYALTTAEEHNPKSPDEHRVCNGISDMMPDNSDLIENAQKVLAQLNQTKLSDAERLRLLAILQESTMIHMKMAMSKITQTVSSADVGSSAVNSHLVDERSCELAD